MPKYLLGYDMQAELSHKTKLISKFYFPHFIFIGSN